MYVRWVVRRHKNTTVADTSFHDAYLVESYRDPGAKPRQRTICYLGNIRQIDGAFPSIERELFLLRADRILASVKSLSMCDRDEAIAALRQRIPPLDRSEVMASFTENLRWYRRWWEENDGGSPSDEELLSIIRAAWGQMGPV